MAVSSQQRRVLEDWQTTPLPAAAATAAAGAAPAAAEASWSPPTTPGSYIETAAIDFSGLHHTF
eukprot:4108329-Pleurochrysis_carterae.AAC.4